MVNYITRKVRKIEISNHFITEIIRGGFGSFIPLEQIPLDLQVIDCKYKYNLVELYVCSDEFDDIPEGGEAPSWIITYKRND